MGSRFRSFVRHRMTPVCPLSRSPNYAQERRTVESGRVPPSSRTAIIDDGDIVFSWSGSLLVRTWCGGRAALNQHLFKVTSDRYPKWFYLHSILSHFPEFQRIAKDKATTMGHIRRHHLTDALCVVAARPLDGSSFQHTGRIVRASNGERGRKPHAGHTARQTASLSW